MNTMKHNDTREKDRFANRSPVDGKQHTTNGETRKNKSGI